MNHLHRTLYSLCLLLALAGQGLAQGQFGSIRGVISDPSGAVVSGAELRATNEKTGVGFSSVSGPTGDFLISGLLPGSYTLTVRQGGFQEYRLTGIVITAGLTERKDVSLTLGEVNQTIEVLADTARLETQSGSIINNVPTRYMERPAVVFYGALLPAANYMTQTPGVTYGGGQDVTAYGSKAKDNRQILDGAVLNADGSSGGVRIPRRSILELQTALVNADAEYATTTTAKMTTAKGTNDLHGEVWTEIGNADLNATPWYAPGRGVGTPDVRFGYRVGGPVVIPGLYNGKNKTFFHTSLERYRPELRFPYPTTVPTERMKAGDLRELGRTVIDPLTGQPFPDNIIPSGRINSVARNTFNRFYPNFTGNFASNNYYAYESLAWSQLDWFFRIDQAIGSKNNLSFSFAHNKYDQNNPIFGGLLSQGRSHLNQSLNFFYISDVHVISPTIMNEANFGFRFGPQQDSRPDTLGQEVNQSLGLPVAPNSPDIYGGPRLNVPGITSVLFNQQSISDARFWTLRDNVSWIRGRWTTKVGVEVINPGASTETYGNVFGAYDFSGIATGVGFADFLLGIPSTTNRAQPFGLSSRVQKLIGIFAQEEFRVSKRLTLTFGGRFQYNTTPIEEQGRIYNFDPKTGNLVVPDQSSLQLITPGLSPALRSRIVTRDQASGFPERLVNPMRQFFPRFGVAYGVNDSTVVRAGYSIYGIQANFGAPTGGPYQAGVEDFTNRMVCDSNNINCQPIFTINNPFPQGPGAQGFRAVSGLAVSGVTPDLRFPLTHQANVSVERRLPWDFVLRASYILTRGTHLPYRHNVNLPLPSTLPYSTARLNYPQWTNTTVTETGGNSVYHGGELQFERRFAKGLAINGGYTLAKCITDADEYDLVAGGLAYLASIGASGPIIESPYDRSRDRGNCHVAPRHTFKTTFAWDLPFGRGRAYWGNIQGFKGGLLNGVLGGWTLSGFYIGQTGRFYSPYHQGFDAAGTGQTDIRPDRIGSGKPSKKDYTSIFNAADFVRPQAGRYGNAGRGIIEGIGGSRVDAGMYKDFRFSSRENWPSLRVGIQSMDFFNVQPKGTFGRTAYIITNPKTVVGRADAYFFDGPTSYNFGSFRTVKFELALQF